MTKGLVRPTRVQTSRFCSNILAWSNQVYTESVKYLHAQVVSKFVKNALASLSIAPKPPLPAPTTGTSRLTLRYVTVELEL